MAFCSNCGKETAENAKFCAACGTPNIEYTAEKQELNQSAGSDGAAAPARRQMSKLTIILGSIAFVLFAFIIISVIFFGDTGGTAQVQAGIGQEMDDDCVDGVCPIDLGTESDYLDGSAVFEDPITLVQASAPTSEEVRQAFQAANLNYAAGRRAADFNLPLLSGQNASLSAYRDNVVIMYFWATWCSACRKYAFIGNVT